MLVSILATFAISLLLTAWTRQYAIRAQIIDVPNNRSSHSIPTPRGGGAGIVGSSLLAFGVNTYYNLIAMPLATAICGGGLVVAIIGIWDDHGHVSPKWRLLCHFFSAGLALSALGAPTLEFMGKLVIAGLPSYILGAFGIVWLLNLYNFMDGIDGIAGIEAVFATASAAALLFVLDAPVSQWLPLLIILSATLGFLVWNFPPAKIFMGDVGSGYLGYSLAALALWNSHFNPAMLWSWIILLGIFITDATTTLLRRLIQGDKVYEAHRTHAYQHAARRAKGHLPVLCATLAINLFWLLPLAYIAIAYERYGAAVTLVAYAPLIALALRFKAGQLEVPK